MNNKAAKGLKVERIKKDLKVRDVAKKLGTSEQLIRRYESGNQRISLEIIEKLLRIYGVDPKVFFANICTNFYD
ncbi:MAG: helix-turn-helix transcriptional regulator [Bacilli bacterium]|nr:helix-turn-helix transcriptional regulator [Bacilli bacterium]